MKKNVLAILLFTASITVFSTSVQAQVRYSGSGGNASDVIRSISNILDGLADVAEEVDDFKQIVGPRIDQRDYTYRRISGGYLRDDYIDRSQEQNNLYDREIFLTDNQNRRFEKNHNDFVPITFGQPNQFDSWNQTLQPFIPIVTICFDNYGYEAACRK